MLESMDFGQEVENYKSNIRVPLPPSNESTDEAGSGLTPPPELADFAVSLFPPNKEATYVEWDGKYYLLRNASADKLSFHLYFGIKTAIEWHRDKKLEFDERHLRLMCGLGSIIRCGKPGHLCTDECKKFGL